MVNDINGSYFTVATVTSTGSSGLPANNLLIKDLLNIFANIQIFGYASFLPSLPRLAKIAIN